MDLNELSLLKSLLYTLLEERVEVLGRIRNYKFPPSFLIKQFFKLERKIADLQHKIDNIEAKITNLTLNK